MTGVEVVRAPLTVHVSDGGALSSPTMAKTMARFR
mgnify:CR=1 FL=1